MGRGVEPGTSRSDGAAVNDPGLLCNSFSGPNNNFDPSWTMAQDSTKMSKLREIVENTTSATRKCVIDNILQQIAQLSDLEKFLLYLKLPMGRSPEPDPLKQPLNPLGSRSEVQLTITWIKAHLEEDLDVSLFKEDVYRKYLQYSGNYQIKHLSKADFGKVMKQVFPKVKARRLGHRGDSRYTYSGLTNKFTVQRPILPDLSGSCLDDDRNSKKMPGLNAMVDNEEEKAANSIILEWAEKMCSLKCSTVTELARQLLNKSYVDASSSSASVLLSDQPSTDVPVGKHQLQRKLQEKEQKRKLQQEVTIETNRNTCDRQKTRRKSGQSRTNVVDENVTCKNIKNNESLQLNVNNNLEEFIRTDDNIFGVAAIMKKEMFDVEHKSSGLCSIGKASFHADTAKSFTTIATNNMQMKVISHMDRDVPSTNMDVLNGNASNDIAANSHCHIEDLSHLAGDVPVVHPQMNDKKCTKNATNGSRYEFLSPITNADCHRDLKIGQIRKMLSENNVGLPNSQRTNMSNVTSLENEHDITSPGERRKVSFQSPDGYNATMLGCPGGQESLPSRVQTFPISYAGNDSIITGQAVSHGSSTNASPFMSPSTTPLLRSRNNSGQTSSTYITPRSTPFTPDTIGQSENSTPFMSPAPTPLYSRSRHNSNQNIRAFLISNSKSRHSSGTASCRHTPYQDELFRRKSRNLSGNMPQSAPLSPRGNDSVFNPLTELSCHSTVEVFQSNMCRKGSMGIISGLPDPRKRHGSAGPTVHYQQQLSPGTFSNCSTNTDSLCLEVESVMSNAQPGQELLTQIGSANRPQSVPLLQMNTGTEANFVAKSYPTTPINHNQHFDFGQGVSHSFSTKPVLNDFTDFTNTALDFVEEVIDHNCGNNTLAAINPTISTLASDLTPTLPTSNISFSETFQSENSSAFNREENVASFLQNVEGTTFTSNPLVPVVLACPQHDSNQDNNVENSCQPLQKQSFSANSHMTLNALNASPMDFQSIERGFDTPADDYGHHYSTLAEQDDFSLFEVNRD